MASLQGLDHIGEKIFKVHNGMDILNFRLVCKSWKHILDNPMYWLKKLNKIGQPKKFYNDSLVLIRKALRIGIPETKIGHCLLIKYLKITEIRTNKDFVSDIKRKLTNLLLRLPLLYCALISQKPDLELIGFLAKSQSNVAKPIKCPPETKYIRGRFSKHHSRRGRKKLSFEFDPLKDSIEGNHDLEVIEILVCQLKAHLQTQQFLKVLKLAVSKQNLEICKLIGKEMQQFKELNWFESPFDNPIRIAIQGKDIQILQYLVSKMKGTFKCLRYNPLREIISFCCYWTRIDFSRSRIHICTEMAYTVLPKIEDINVKNYGGKSFLNETLAFALRSEDKKCAIGILKLIAPLCDFKDLNAEDLY